MQRFGKFIQLLFKRSLQFATFSEIYFRMLYVVVRAYVALCCAALRWAMFHLRLRFSLSVACHYWLHSSLVIIYDLTFLRICGLNPLKLGNNKTSSVRLVWEWGGRGGGKGGVGNIERILRKYSHTFSSWFEWKFDYEDNSKYLCRNGIDISIGVSSNTKDYLQIYCN